MAAAASDGPVESHSWRGLVAVAATAAVIATAPWWAGRGGPGAPARPTVLDAAVERPTITVPLRASAAPTTSPTARPAIDATTTTSTAPAAVPTVPQAIGVGGTDSTEVGADDPAASAPTAPPATAASGASGASGADPSPTTEPAAAATTVAAPPAPVATTTPDTAAPPTTAATAPATTAAPAATTTTTTTVVGPLPLPLPLVTFGVLCSPVGALGVTLAGTPALCSPTNGQGRPNGDGRARWRHG